MNIQRDKAATFAQLHRSDGAFNIPNPWDIGSARVLEALGFESLATTSSGFANTIGRVDGQITLEEKLAHCASLCSATTLAISADLEQCFADDPSGVAATISKVDEVGIVGA